MSLYTTPSYYGNYNQNYSSSYYPWDYYCLYYGGFYCRGNSSGLSITNVSGPNSLSVGQQGTWSVTTNAPVNSYISVTVSWGDHGYAYPMASAASQVSQRNTFSHAYTAAGTYIITFTATDSTGRSNTSTATVQVDGVWCTYNCGTYGTFTASPTSGAAPLSVNFSYPYSSNTQNGLHTVNFGDGTSGQMTAMLTAGACSTGYCAQTGSWGANHTYSTAGTYTAELVYQPPFTCNAPPGAACAQVMPASQVLGTVTITVTSGTSCGYWGCSWPYQPQDYPNYQNYYYQNTYGSGYGTGYGYY